MSTRHEEIKKKLLATFRIEAVEHLQAVREGLAALERAGTRDEALGHLEATFRAMHTLKGAARSVSLREIEARCQACEAQLAPLARGEVAYTAEMIDSIHEAAAELALLLAGEPSSESRVVPPQTPKERPAESPPFPSPAPLPVTPPASAPKPGPSASLPLSLSDTLRVSAAKLDDWHRQAEDLVVMKLATAEGTGRARKLLETLIRCRTSLSHVRGEASRDGQSGSKVLMEVEGLLQEVEAEARQFALQLRSDQRALSGTVDGLFERMRNLRMMPASTVLDVFPGMVRDLARQGRKMVEWVVQGADLEVDRKLLEAMKDPLIHLVRNAVDHGIETPEKRAAAGKPSAGRVGVSLRLVDGRYIELCVEDDGVGIELGRVKEAAVRRQLLSPEAAERLADEDILDLVYRSGLSTSPIITDVSGYGLGLAIVRERVERLEGRIRVDSRPGAGTAVRMWIPASIASFSGLLVRSGGQPFLLPTHSVEQVLRMSADPLQSGDGRGVLPWRGKPVQLVPLSSLLGLSRHKPEGPDAQVPVAVIAVGEDRVAVILDELVGHQEVLVKELSPPLLRVRNIAACGLLGTGEIALILRVSDLLKSARYALDLSPSPHETEEDEGPKVVLVVDDSITTRTMEKNLLEAAGYQVRVAVDGVDAEMVLRSEHVDLVLSDVDMPRRNGLELTARIRADPKLQHLPVVLVTALESREDKERGMEVGANAYMVKSGFDQSKLLELIRQLA